MSVKIPTKDYVDGLLSYKKAKISPIVFQANVAKQIATTAQIGCNIQKLVTGIATTKFFTISSSNNFIYSIFIDSNGTDIYFVTNVSQTLSFEIAWIEKN